MLEMADTLDDLIDACALQNACTDRSCGTCGAGPLRKKVHEFSDAKIKERDWHMAIAAGATTSKSPKGDFLLYSLKRLKDGSIRPERRDLHRRRHAIIRVILLEIEHGCRDFISEAHILDVLGDSQAGRTYQAILAKRIDDAEKAALKAALYDPEAEEREKQIKLAEKAAKLEQRRKQKEEIDRIWREKQSSKPTVH